MQWDVGGGGGRHDDLVGEVCGRARGSQLLLTNDQ